jgi:hypothetical protein
VQACRVLDEHSIHLQACILRGWQLQCDLYGIAWIAGPVTPRAQERDDFWSPCPFSSLLPPVFRRGQPAALRKKAHAQALPACPRQRAQMPRTRPGRPPVRWRAVLCASWLFLACSTTLKSCSGRKVDCFGCLLFVVQIVCFQNRRMTTLPLCESVCMNLWYNLKIGTSGGVSCVQTDHKVVFHAKFKVALCVS